MFSGSHGFLGEKWRSVTSQGVGGCDCRRDGEWRAGTGLQCVSCISPRHFHISQEGFHFVEKQLNKTQKQQNDALIPCISYVYLKCISKVNMISNICHNDSTLSVMRNTNILKMAGLKREYYSDIKLFRICLKTLFFLITRWDKWSARSLWSPKHCCENMLWKPFRRSKQYCWIGGILMLA